jgi:3-hydroxyisobutyrate dehydrogenase
MRIAVLGLGLMGAAIAQRLRQEGLDVIGWNRAREKCEALAAQGMQVADSAAEAIARSEMTALVLSDAAAIRETLFNADVPAALSGHTFIQLGTIAPAESQDIAGRIAAHGGEYLESPVLGSLPEAGAGKLLVMAGGDESVFRRCLPLLQALSREPRLIGVVGQGAALKLAMNQLIAGLTATFSLSLGLVRAEGIEVSQFMQLLRGSALYAPTFDKKLDKCLSRRYGEANFSLKHLLKDVRLFRQVAEQIGMDTALAVTIEAACIRALDKGYGDQDYSSLYEALTPD